jgi:hypothetical protein
MSQKIRVLIYPVGEPPREVVIDSDLSAFQKVVGGYIEVVGLACLPSGGTIDLICNEEGLIYGLPFNRYVDGHRIVGQFLIMRHNSEGEPSSLSPVDVRRYTRVIH